MKFEDYYINPDIKRSLEEMGFKRPTDIQFKSIPPILKRNDLLAIAQTGTGKTAAFAIPIINIVSNSLNRKAREIKCLVMVPTRELGVQITKVFRELSKYTKVKTISLFGGVEQEPQIAELEKGVDILVTTPGRMFDLESQGYVKLDSLEILVLDEADHMLDLGFIKDIRQLITHLPKRRQTLFFSATIDKKIKELAYSLVNKPIRIQISPKDPVSKNVTHLVAHIEMDDKRFFLERLVKENPESKILVFVRTKVRAERVLKAMERVNMPALAIHGDVEQKKRLNVMKQFNAGEVKMLITTDVSARGIDIPDVEYVVNYDLPEQAENYVHRVGRTGRGTNKGFAYSFCSKEEQELLQQIEEYIGKPVLVLELDKTEYSETLAISNESHEDWKTLMKQADEFPNKKKKKGKRKK